MNNSTVKSLFFALFIFSPFFIMNGFSIVYANCGENLNGTVFCVDLQSPDRLPKLQAGTTCEISSEVDITYSDDYSNMNECRTEGIFFRNWRVTDACGDTIYCTQRINVQFNTILECINPNSSLSCIDELTPETGKGLLFLTQSCLNPSAFIYTPTDDLSNLSELGEGFVIRTWELSHPCGYTRTCSQRINIQNNTDPTVLCEPDNRVQECNGLRDNEAAAFSWNEANKKKLKLCSVDNCSNVTITSDFDFTNLSDECGFTGTMMVTYIITDLVGNSTTKTATFTITDTTAPNGNFGETNTVINCTDVPSVKDFLIERNTININELANFSTENCGNLTVTSDFNPSSISENCQSQQETTVTYTLADECDNFETFVWNYTIIDRAISDVLCEELEIVAINNELIIDNLFAPNSIVKIFDTNWQPIFDCSGDCPESITIPDLNTDEIYHTDIQLYDANWQFICEEKQDITVMGITPPCNVSICTRDVVFQTQEALDAFCGCEVIRGDLYIGAERNPFREIPESNINSLASFRGLRKVEGSIIIVKTQLTDLKGLEELADVHALIISENGQLKSLDGLRKVKKVNSTLAISKNPQLNSLAGLSNLSEAGSQLNITENLRLEDLSALSNLKKAVSINISKNASLQRLDGLESIDSLKSTNDNLGYLSISKNPLLSDIEALATWEFIESSLYISENPLLENCCPITHLIDEDSINGIVIGNISISQNGIAFCGNKEEIIESCQTSMPCDTSICQGDVILQTQAEVDAFCGCEVIEGNLVIGSVSTDINNLGSLQGVKVIKQGLVITQTSDLLSLKPLANLREIGGNFIFGANQSVTDFDGLQALTEVGGRFYIENNGIISLAGLQQLTNIGGAFEIVNNYNLTALTNFDKLTYLTELLIGNNDKLLSLEGLNALSVIENTLIVAQNEVLSDCCQILHLIDGNLEEGVVKNGIQIDNNPAFCSSIGEVIITCRTAPPTCENIQIFTENNQIVLEGLMAPNEIAKVFDANYDIIFNCSGDCPETITIPNLAAGGMYHTDIQFYDESWNFICEDKQDIVITGDDAPCDTSICQGDVILRTQAEVDAFCGCEVIEGDLIIGETRSGSDGPVTDIDNIRTITRVTTVKGSLVVRKTGLINLLPLKGITTIGNTLSISWNPNLVTLQGLEYLKIVDRQLVIESNELLVNFDELSTLEKVGKISLIGKSINSVVGFRNLKSNRVTGLSIVNCDQLKSLNGLEVIDSIADSNGQGIGNLTIAANDMLENMDAVGNIRFAKGLTINQNPVLTNCCAIAHLIDDDLQNGKLLEQPFISDNAEFCNSATAIIQNCQTLPPTCENIQILTENNQIVIEGLTAPNEIIKVFDKDFNIIYECAGDCEETQIVGTFPIGNYTVDLQLYDENWALICAEQRGVTLINGNPCNDTDCETIAPILGNIPADLTLECDDSPEISEAITVTDNCDNDVEITFIEEKITGNCSSNYQIIRTWTATDDCGNTASAQQVIVVGDFTAPTLTNLPPDLTFNVEDGFDTTFPILLDNCDAAPLLTVEDVVNPTETEIVRTFTATDNCGNTATAQQIITIIRDEIDLCADLLITTSANSINFAHVDAPNSIVKVFDANYQIIFDCTATCESEFVVPVEGIGIYHTDVQFYDGNWAFICKDRQDIEVVGGSEPCDTSICQGDVFLRTQVEVDAFCGCEVIEGNLIIGQRADNTVLATINDLASLVNLKRVNGSINIVNTTIAKLTDLTNLSHVEGTLAIDNNPNLKEVDGLENVKFVGLQLVSTNNANLTDLSAWSGIKQIGGGLILSNSALTSLAFLSNLENDKLLRIEITGCDNLTSLHGLEGINGVTSVIGTALLIASNERLIDLQAIKNIKQVAGGFVVAANPELADCCVIAHLVDADPNNGIVEGITVIQENGDFCNSVEAIVQNCQNAVDPSCTDINIETTTNSMTISNLTAPIEILKVFDANYKIIYECFADCEATITVPDLVAGKYHLGINFYDEHWQDICELIQTVQIADNALDRNINLLPADFSLYPNPATAETFIDLSKLKGETVQLELFNQFGQKVKQQMVANVTAQKEKIDLSALQNGVYILQIKANGKRPITKKLMVTRLY